MFLTHENHSAQGIWDQRSFDIFEALLPEERRAADEKRLKDIFAYAAGVPIAAQALEWARDHGVRFMIDHKTKGSTAYYKAGMGLVALGLDSLDHPQTTMPFVMRQLTHEIRHMWQDYEGWLSHDQEKGFPHLCMVTNVREADAGAFGNLAQGQAMHADRYRTAAEADRLLALAFGGWFCTEKPQVYGERTARIIGAQYDLCDMQPGDSDSEMKALSARLRPPLLPLDFSDEVEVIRRIGKTFDGRNYLAGHEEETAVRDIFDSRLALCFHDGARDKPDDLVMQIIAAEETRRPVQQPRKLRR